LRNSKKEFSEFCLFAEYFNPEHAIYLSWFTSPGASENSLERELLSCEDIFVLSWKLSFTQFEPIENRLNEDNIDKGALIKQCNYMIHLIDMYNKYNLQIHCKDEEFITEKEKWELYIQRIEGIIGQEEMNRSLKVKEEEEKKKNLEKQVEQEKQRTQAKDDARKNDPFSSQNLYKKDDDPFKDILLLEVVDIYGSLEGEIWSKAQSEKDVPPPDDDDYYNNLLKELDISDLDLDLEIGSFQLPMSSQNQKKTLNIL